MSKLETWSNLYRNHLINARPGLWDELQEHGQESVEDHVRNRVEERIESYEDSLKDGASEEVACELALADLLGIDEDDTEDYEIEDGMEEHASALFDFLGIEHKRYSEDDDDEGVSESD